MESEQQYNKITIAEVHYDLSILIFQIYETTNSTPECWHKIRQLVKAFEEKTGIKFQGF